MIIHKFGGAAVKDANGVRNLSEILKNRQENKVVVISAFGKTTNNLEELTLFAYRKEADRFESQLKVIRDYHLDIVQNLFSGNHFIFNEIDSFFSEIESYYNLDYREYDHLYDQIVAYGELLSTKVVQAYLRDIGMPYEWLDIRKCLITDETYREANILWFESEGLVQQRINSTQDQIITQGFIACNRRGETTTLGREGSDYTAAVLGYVLKADQVIIWKDVPGVLNADPRYFKETRRLNEISYQEAIELAYYGAKIIHPKTIKPLKNRNIPLMVYSFIHPASPGTIISDDSSSDDNIPVFIVKKEQILISISPHDFSFIFEEELSKIYQRFAEYRVKVNLMQNSAITFTVSVDRDNPKIALLIDELRKEYKILYNENLELITVIHYTEVSLKEVVKNRKILIEQRSRDTAQFILENKKDE
jgi:aspartate kinase